MQRTAPRPDASPPRNCSHQALPFVKAPAKAKLAGSIETQPGVYLAALSAFRIVGVPVMAARNKDVQRERIVFAFHCLKLGFNIAYRRGQSFQRVFKASGPHCVQVNIIITGCQKNSVGHEEKDAV